MESHPRPRAFSLAGGVFAGLALAFAPPAIAMDEVASSPAEEAGWRKKWLARGIDIQLSHTNEAAANIRGGERKLLRQAGQLTLGAALDLERLRGWQGAAIRFTVTGRHGEDLTTDAGLGSLQQVQEVYGRNQTWRLTQLWYSQALFDGRADLKLGRVTVGEDFAAFSCDFMNLTFCGSQPGNLVGHYWYSWPVSQWGAVVKGTGSATTYLKLGAYQVNPSYLRTRNAIKLHNPPGTTGALLPLEFGWTPTLTDSIDGSYKVGLWYDTSRYPDVYTDTSGGSAARSGLPFAQRRGAHGVYFNAEQQLTTGDRATARSGLRIFLNATQADRATSITDRQVALGLTYTGPFASRTRDDIALGVGMTHVNGRVARFRRDHAAAPSIAWGNEYAAELHYTWRTRRGMTLRPAIQFIRHPGGSRSRSDVTVIGLQTSTAI
jgi:porin